MNSSEFIAHVRSFTNILDPAATSDATISGWMIMAESAISEKLRIADMLQIDTATIGAQVRVPFPTDYIAADLIRDLDNDGKPFSFKPRFEFYDMDSDDRSRLFTQSGGFIEFGGDVTGHEIELHYFGDVPNLTGAATWLSTRYNALLTAATLAVAFAANDEDAKSTGWQNNANDQINTLNDRYRVSIGAGSKLTRTMRSFG